MKSPDEKALRGIRLIAADMDNTLLTSQGALPPDFNRCVPALDALGITVVIASGRALYTLEAFFASLIPHMSFISDNGGLISHKGTMLFRDLLKVGAYHEMIRFVQDETDGIPILCGMTEAYAPEQHRRYEAYLRYFYSKITFVSNLADLAVEANKFTVYFPQKNSKTWYETHFKAKYGGDFSVTLGDTVWIDIMNFGVHKGKALQTLGARLGIRTEQMMAFGDHYNDKEMLQSVHYSYIVANAPEDMRQYARFLADSNDNFGVIKVIEQVLQSHR
ncbi:MAG: Cof-type HAD-IIB family hydrolase [Spirochaetaceae bacterium]|jgi:Cof subfamily protein (haloacid dehalogenase superfamily)|nr:Cof-type HAD-IIB family hydrolase [Spirochaetaceae bacterium]